LTDTALTQRASTDAGDKHLNVRVYVTLPCIKKLSFTYFIHKYISSSG